MNLILLLLPFICLVISVRAQNNVTQEDVSTDEWKYGFGECVHGVRTMYFYKDSEQTCNAQDNQVVGKRK